VPSALLARHGGESAAFSRAHRADHGSRIHLHPGLVAQFVKTGATARLGVN